MIGEKSIMEPSYKAFVHSVNVNIEYLQLFADRLDTRKLEVSITRAIRYMCEDDRNVFAMGIGKSAIVARKFISSLMSVGKKSWYVHPTEAAHGDLGLIKKHDIVFLFSNGGLTEEINKLLAELKRRDVMLIAITGYVDSYMGRQCHCTIDIGHTQESDPLQIIPTTSYTKMSVIGDGLVSGYMVTKNVMLEEYKKSHPGGAIGEKLKGKENEMDS